MKRYFFFLFVLYMFGVAAQQQPNVLFIVMDDLRPELNCYGKTMAQSPNIDKLAASGMLFNNAFCNIPVCGASRASVLTGVRPVPGIFETAASWADEDAPNVTVLPQLFKNNGYRTISNGKVFHHETDREASWDVQWRPDAETWALEESEKIVEKYKKGPITECADVPDNAFFDGQLAEKTVADLKQLKASGEPFFLACGFIRPHLPFVAPKKYWDIYPAGSVKPAENNYAPKNAPKQSIHGSAELKQYYGETNVPLSDSAAVNMVHGYYACVSYSDTQVGKVLAALEETGLAENTIVILWGDHGWNLREHGMWAKHCNYKTSLNAPLIVRLPGMKGGQKTSSITEFIDIYPTLCDLCGLEKPTHLDGKSFVSTLKNPTEHHDKYAVARFRGAVTIITEKYYYTEWLDKNNAFVTRMLYDHETDDAENINISEDPEMQETVKQLSGILKQERGF